jgi:hypothetical protein
MRMYLFSNSQQTCGYYKRLPVRRTHKRHKMPLARLSGRMASYGLSGQPLQPGANGTVWDRL